MKKGTALQDLVSRLIPDQIEDVWQQVDRNVRERTKAGEDESSLLRNMLEEVMEAGGEPARQALYAILCDRDSMAYQMMHGAVSKGASQAVGLLIPILVAQFALSGPVVPLIATLVVRYLATQTGDKLCDDLSRQQPKAKPAARKTSERPKSKAAESEGKAAKAAPSKKPAAKRKSTPATAKADEKTSVKPSSAKKPATKPAAAKKKPAQETTSKAKKPAAKRKKSEE